mgnify:CR=1 FL=1
MRLRGGKLTILRLYPNFFMVILIPPIFYIPCNTIYGKDHVTNQRCNSYVSLQGYIYLHRLVLILEGKSEIGALVWSDIGNFIRLVICLHRQQSQILYLFQKDSFLNTCSTFSELPSNIGTMYIHSGLLGG